MNFDSDKPIYLQICDSLCEGILSGQWASDARIPSVREYAALIGVNPNTVMRSYEKLTGDGVIYNRRGLGYFVSADARKVILEEQRREFIQVEMPQILRRMKLLGLDPSIFVSESNKENNNN